MEIKKYIKLEDGRVLESNSCIIVNNIKGDKYYIKENSIDFSTYAKVIASSDYLHNFYDSSNVTLPGLDVVVHFSDRHNSGYYCTFFDFDEDTECYVDDDCRELPIEDGEVFLGSWYGGGMRFVAKWDREKKDWVLI